MTKTMTPQEYLEYLPARILGLAMDDDWSWHVFCEEPYEDGSCWKLVDMNPALRAGVFEIIIDYSGNWKDSWTSRKLTFGDLEIGQEFWVDDCGSRGQAKKFTKNAYDSARSTANIPIDLNCEVTLND